MNIQDRATALKARIRHFPPTDDHNGVTVAYRDLGHTLIAVSTATCSRLDVFKKKVGGDLALAAMEEGREIQLPLFARKFGVARDNNIAREELVQLTLETVFGGDFHIIIEE